MEAMKSSAMTSRERTAYCMGLEVAVDLALLLSNRIEEGASAAKEAQAAELTVAALRELAASVAAVIHAEPPPEGDETMRWARAMVAAERGDGGTIPCPACNGRLDWIRSGGKSSAWCHTRECVSWLT